MRNEGRIVVAVALLFLTTVGAVGLTVKAQAADVLYAGGGEELVGSYCGTVSPDGRSECCARQNEGRPQVRCVGYWEYIGESGECRFVCGFREE